MIAEAASPSSSHETRGWWWLATSGLLVAGAGVLVAALFTAFGSHNPDELGWDFRVAYYPAMEAILAGESPYPSDPNDPGFDFKRAYAYPPQFAVAFSPLSLLPVDVAVVVAVLGSLASLFAALNLVGVRDVRCYAVVPIWGSAWNALEMANLSAFLALLLALVWRYRETLWPFALAVGTMVSLKLFLWPLLVWAAVSGRLRGTALAVSVAVGLTLGSWALIGFAGLESYRDLLERIAMQESYSIKGIALEAGLGSFAAYAIVAVVSVCLVGVCVQFARRGDDERAFITAVLAALAVSPVVWLHYLVLLAVPLGIARPRFSVLWLVPIVLWVCPRSENGDGLETFLPAAVAAIVLGSLLLRRRESVPAVAT